MLRHAIPLLILALAAGCDARPTPVDSSAPAFAAATDRVAWMKAHVRGGPPSAIRDAQFFDREMKVPAGHMGPGYSMHWFYVKIEIDPKDAPAWAARTKATPGPSGWRRDANPLKDTGAAWSLGPADFDGAAWYDPAPLFGSGAHAGYQAGHMVIPRSGDAIYVWQHWR